MTHITEITFSINHTLKHYRSPTLAIYVPLPVVICGNCYRYMCSIDGPNYLRNSVTALKRVLDFSPHVWLVQGWETVCGECVSIIAKLGRKPCLLDGLHPEHFQDGINKSARCLVGGFFSNIEYMSNSHIRRAMT